MPTSQPIAFLNNEQLFKRKWNELFEKTQTFLFSNKLTPNTQDVAVNTFENFEALKSNTLSSYDIHLSLMRQRLLNLMIQQSRWEMLIAATTALSFSLFLWACLPYAVAALKSVGMFLQILTINAVIIETASSTFVALSAFFTIGLGLTLASFFIGACAYGLGHVAFNSVSYLIDSLSSYLSSVTLDALVALDALDALKAEHLELIKKLEQELGQGSQVAEINQAEQSQNERVQVPSTVQSSQYMASTFFSHSGNKINPAHISADCVSVYSPQENLVIDM